MLETELRPLPSLAPSFALFGAMTGFFALLGLGAVDDGCRYMSPWIAAGCSAIAGGVLGVVLRRYRALRNPMSARENVYIRLGLLLLVAGGVAGLATGAASMAVSSRCLAPKTVEASGAMGVLIGALLVPACAAVYFAALRARARPGSVVSRADRGSIRVVLFMTLSFFALAAVPAIWCEAYSHFLDPVLQVMLTALAPVACGVGIFVADLLTLRSQRRCEELALRRDGCAPAEANDATAIKVSDLGLGEEQWSELRLRHAYRGARDASVVLRGSVEEARSAILEARASARTSMFVALGMSGLIGVSSAFSPMFKRHDVWLNQTKPSPTFTAAALPSGLSSRLSKIERANKSKPRPVVEVRARTMH